MHRGTRVQRTRPAAHHSVIVFVLPHNDLFVSQICVDPTIVDKNEPEYEESVLVDTKPKRRIKKVECPKEKAVKEASKVDSDVDSEVEDIEKHLNEFYDDVADESLYFEDADGNRLMSVDNGRKLAKFDEKEYEERQRRRAKKLELEKKAVELRGQPKPYWFGYYGVHGPAVAKLKTENEQKAPPLKTKISSVKKKTPASPLPKSFVDLRNSILLLSNRRVVQKSISVVENDVAELFPKFALNRTSFTNSSLSRRTSSSSCTVHDPTSVNSDSTLKDGLINERTASAIFAESPQERRDKTNTESTKDQLLTSAIADVTSSRSFLFPSAPKTSVTTATAGGFFKSTPKRASHVATDLPTLALSPIMSTSSTSRQTECPQGSFVTSTPLRTDEECERTRKICSKTITHSIADIEEELCDISGLSLDQRDEEETKIPLSAVENITKDKQSPGNKRASSEKWNPDGTITDVIPNDKKRKTDMFNENENSNNTCVSKGQLSENVSVEEDNLDMEEIGEKENLDETLSVRADPAVRRPAASIVEDELSVIGNELVSNHIEQATLNVDATEFGNTLAVDAVGFGNTMGDQTGLTNTMLADATDMMLKTRNATQIISFYGNESRGEHVERIPFFLRGYSGSNDLDQLLFVVQQTHIFSWKELNFKTPKKLGEGVYGEVFATNYCGQNSAVKIIPFAFKDHEFDGLVNGETLWAPSDLMPEILITRELAQLHSPEALFSTPNFIGLLGTHLTQGCYPQTLLKAWDVYDKEKCSENDRPSIYSAKNRLHLVICLAMGGQDLENFQVYDESQVISILLQVALSLMVAEQELEFEHRDLHVGNILVLKNDEDIKYRYNGEDLVLMSHGVKINLIDFTLSRMKKDGTVLYRNLSSDEELFQGTGSYQFDMYRMMRDHNKDDWLNFNPKTNVFWMHYLSLELLKNKKYTKPIPPARKKKLLNLFDRLLEFETISELFTDPQFTDLISPFLKK